MLDENQLWRAQTYALLASLFVKAPEPELLQNIAAIEVTEPETAIGKAWSELSQAAATVDPQQLSYEYQTVFIGITEGEVIPYGSYYQSGFLHEKPLALLRADLAHLGLERQQNTSEPEDHIAAECDVMRLILSAEGAPVVDEKTFYQRHLQPWVLRFSSDLQQAPSAHFYRHVAALAQAFFSQESALLK